MSTLPALPDEFVRSMTGLLGEEAEALFRSYEEKRVYGLRLNSLKLTDANPVFSKMSGLFDLRPVPWCPDGFFYDEKARPGRHPYHAAGLYYIQEPSAMIAAELLDPQPGEIVLDLAAAPGGKTTQIAARMRGEGLLVANEIHPARAKILSENVERLGITRAIVTQASPQELASRFPERFDRVLLDAPCSGEGMFRKDPDAKQMWSPEAVQACAIRQQGILPFAAAMLKPGGTLVYSTCTFNTVENEDTIAVFLERHPEFRLVREERMWPFRGQGEGHYAALLHKEQGASESEQTFHREPSAASRRHRDNGQSNANEHAALSLYEAFAEESLPRFRLPAAGAPLLFGDALYWLPQPPAAPLSADTLRGLRVPRPGLHLGDLRKGRFEPSHALAMAVTGDAASLTADYAADSAEISAYLRGETLPAAPGARGWGLTTVEGFPLGWFKASDGQQKNRLPKGLRSLTP